MEDPLKQVPSAYVAAEHESKLYELWEKSGFFNPDTLPGERTEAFSMVMPPPNVTGTLHVGHAVMLALQDILTRYNRMKGKKALWIPGLDHAAIATQNVVEKKLKKENIKGRSSRHDLGREAFLKEVESFVEATRDRIITQIRAMGASCDWSRLAYTLDEPRTKAVRTMFKSMYDAGVLYRGNRIVNWCPRCQSTLADDEVVHKDQDASLYTFTYAKDFPIAIATTRPETKLGDTGVAVHPSDPRYAALVGKTYSVQFAGQPLEIQVIADATVDPAFGTGAVGLTPAHSAIDADMAEKHGLPSRQVISERATMMNVQAAFDGKKTIEARVAVVEWLRAEGLLQKEEKIQNNLSVCYRCDTAIEPLPKLQWFVAVSKPFRDGKSLKDLMLAAVTSGGVQIIPERFEKNYHHWIANLRDWCISRQIWFGHRLPVYYKGDEVHVGENPGDGWTQDPDTLDTWFSSGMWTFSTLGWPEKTKDLETFHPTTVLETGYDILFFWIARMILMSEFALGEIPFKFVYLHGLVRDMSGRKMSKSLGNIIDPLDMVAKYGADAVRLALFIGTAAGTDTKLNEQKIAGYRNFANKIWNASRFVVMNLGGQTVEHVLTAKPPLSAGSHAVLAELDATIKEVTKNLEAFDFNHAGDALYHYFWHTFADKIIEQAKEPLKKESEQAEARYVLVTVLTTCLKALHPFMPFVTEAVWQTIIPRESKTLLMVESWPQ